VPRLALVGVIGMVSTVSEYGKVDALDSSKVVAESPKGIFLLVGWRKEYVEVGRAVRECGFDFEQSLR
jgi:hypothetical protein